MIQLRIEQSRLLCLLEHDMLGLQLYTLKLRLLHLLCFLDHDTLQPPETAEI